MLEAAQQCGTFFKKSQKKELFTDVLIRDFMLHYEKSKHLNFLLPPELDFYILKMF